MILTYKILSARALRLLKLVDILSQSGSGVKMAGAIANGCLVQLRSCKTGTDCLDVFPKGACCSYILTLAPATGSQVFNKFVEHPGSVQTAKGVRALSLKRKKQLYASND
jgi:hypothetical protein